MTRALEPRERLAIWFMSVSLCLTPASGQGAGSYAERSEVKHFVAQVAEQYGFESDQLMRVFRHARFLPSVIKAILPPASPSVRSWHKYQARHIEASRIDGGLEFWQRHADALAEAQARYGVPAEIIVAIIGVETIYGRMTGNFQTLSALTTLAFDYPPRAELFRHELQELLLLARERNRSPLTFSGSFAGAIGIPQFLPSSYRRFAVDFDGDGKVDLSLSERDAIGSVANFLQQHGWQSGHVVTLPAAVSGTTYLTLADGNVEPRYTREDLAAHGIAAAGQPDEPSAVIDLASPGEPTEYWLGFRNFYVLTRYNRSSFYAMAVYRLSQKLRSVWDAGRDGAR